MIILGLKSAGIGNCMFQYAAAKSLAVRLNTSVKLDVSGLREQQMPFRAYSDSDITEMLNQSLNVFKLKCEIANEKEVSFLRGWGDERKIRNKVVKRIRHKLGVFQTGHFLERASHIYDKSFDEVRGDIYLDGLFINPKHFQFIHSELRKDFEFRDSLDIVNTLVLNNITENNSVSIHVRRGDYVNPDITSNIYATCDRTYYEKAIRVIERRVSDPKYFVFSDDSEWAKKNLEFIGNTVFVDHNPIESGYKDLNLMSQCKHNIIVNSTFSWWAAWLNDNPDKVVVVPQKWRNDSVDTSVLLGEGWDVLN